MVFPASDPDGAAAYAKMIAPVFEFEIPDPSVKTPFASETDVFCLPDVTVSRVRISTGARLTRTFKTIARTATDDIMVVCYTSGHYTYRIGNTQRRVELGEVALYDLSQELTIEAPYVENVSFTVSRRRLEAIVPLVDSGHGFVVPAGALTRVLMGAAENVIAAGASTPSSEARPIADALVLLVGACLDMASQPKSAVGAAAAVSLAGMKAAIERRLTDPDLGPQTLLDEFGITRSTLYRAFEPLGGVSAYISERRLRYAFRQMTNPAQKDLRLSQLAFELGFAHASAFTRSFKAQFGLTPKDVRTLAIRPEGEDRRFALSPAAASYFQPITP